jgi:putative zinc finger/helix-turn-helix YgiT family protein
MVCSVCESGKIKKVRKPYQTKYNGQIVSLLAVETYRCSDCQEDFFTPEQARSVSVQVKNTVRQSLGLLPPERILAIREKLGLTQIELEHLLDQGPKVVTRWESGRVVQNKNADTVLRLLDRKPEILPLIRQIEKSRNRAQKEFATAAS